MADGRAIMGKAVTGFFVLVTAIAMPVMCSQGVRESREARDSCVERGVDYFRSMGVSALDGGRKPRDVAEDRCSRSLAAFGSPG